MFVFDDVEIYTLDGSLRWEVDSRSLHFLSLFFLWFKGPKLADCILR